MNSMKITRIDLHMHSTVSDGTDTPEEILKKVKQAGIGLFALTDHDAIKGAGMIREILREDDPCFLSGAEFSCKDEEGKYHILGYGYDPSGDSIRQVVETGHAMRMRKVRARLDLLQTSFGFVFPEEEILAILAMDNPGKPHIGNMMVKCGYAQSKEQAINEFINQIHIHNVYLRPETAIRGILLSGGIPVLAHPPFGSGDELITGGDLEKRVKRLMDYGLRGMEGFYSGYTPKLRAQTLSIAEKYGLLVTAGSDYHGKNKLVTLGDTKLDLNGKIPDGLRRFLEETGFLDQMAFA